MATAEENKIALLWPRVAEGSDSCEAEILLVRVELYKAFKMQSDFRVLMRNKVDTMLIEQGFQRTGVLNDTQRKDVGNMTGAQYICVSTVTKNGSKFHIESYLVNVETGQVTNPATRFADVQNHDYKILQVPCNQLVKEMLGEIGVAIKSSTKADSKQLPAGYVDLGLPSGTLWKTVNEDCGLITYDQAVNFYGSSLPTKEQWEELEDYCKWYGVDDGCIVIGRKGEYMFIPVAGYRWCDGSTTVELSRGYYWSSTPDGSGNAWFLYFGSSSLIICKSRHCNGRSVRLVK